MKTSILASLAIIFISITHIFATLPELNTYDSFLDKKMLSKKQLSKGSKNKPVKKNITPHKYNYKPNKSTIRDKKLKSKKVESGVNKKLKNKKDSQDKKLQSKKNIKLKKGVGEKKVKEKKVVVKKVKDKTVKDKTVKDKSVRDKKNKKDKRGSDGRGVNNKVFNFTKTHKTKKRNELLDSAIKGGIDLVTPLGALNFSDLGSTDGDSADEDNGFDIDEDDDKEEYNKEEEEENDDIDEGDDREEYKEDEDGKNDRVEDEEDDREEDGDEDYSGDVESGGDAESEDQDDDRTYYDSDQDESRNAVTSLDGDENEENAVGLEEEEDYNQENKTQSKYKTYETNISYVNGMEYLGVGYDITKGNPFGDIDGLLDPGYKYPVIAQKIKRFANNISGCFNINSILSIPAGIWVRKLSNCAKQEKTINLSQINNSIQTKNVKNDVKLDIEVKGEEEGGGNLSFTWKFLYDNLRRLGSGKNNNIHQHIVNCFKYLAGYDIPIDKLTHSIEFAQFVKSLPLEFISDGCTGEFYKNNPKDIKCKSVDGWMKLFTVFGTHFVTLVFLGLVYLYLGGKLIVNQFANDKQNIQTYEDMAKIDLAVAVKSTDLAINGDYNSSNHSKDNQVQSSSSTYFMGGSMANPTENMALWYESLSNHSMPIKITIEPLYLIMPKQLVKLYKLAYKYYVGIN